MLYLSTAPTSSEISLTPYLSDGYMISELKDVFVNGAPHG
jgi:hypothetical protein